MGKERIVGEYPQILQAISPLFAMQSNGGSSESTKACMDNAAAAIARMIMACPANVPLPEVIPAFLAVLPLKTDMTENETVYKCLMGLLQMNQGDIMSRKDDVRRIFLEATNEASKVDTEIQNELKQALH